MFGGDILSEFDVVNRMKSLCAMRSWTSYRLAKESGITYSTLNSMLNHGTIPSIPTLSKICDGFGISMSQFFSEDDVTATLTTEQVAFAELWNTLSDENRATATKFIQYLQSQQE